MNPESHRTPVAGERDSQPHILNASSNLLGICFVILTGLKLTGTNIATYLDETASLAAVLFTISCFTSYASIRTPRDTARLEAIADWCFLLALTLLLVAVLVFAIKV